VSVFGLRQQAPAASAADQGGPEQAIREAKPNHHCQHERPASPDGWHDENTQVHPQQGWR
jgi:hypothetical protein